MKKVSRNVTRVAVVAILTGVLMSCTTNPDDDDEFDGYKTVKIGRQVWMAENLNYASKSSTCYNNDTINCNKYGRLYSFEEATKVCPPGWRLPKNADWDTLITFAGGRNIAGTKLKAKKEIDPNNDGTDDFGFTALLGGLQFSDGHFGEPETGIWWSSSGEESDRFEDHFIMGLTKTTAILEGCGSPQNKHSVRCIKNDN